MSKPYNRLDKTNAAVLLVDHQAGLLSLVRKTYPETDSFGLSAFSLTS